jgi:hypothetical protein
MKQNIPLSDACLLLAVNSALLVAAVVRVAVLLVWFAMVWLIADVRQSIHQARQFFRRNP